MNEFETSLTSLAASLTTAKTIVFDWETSYAEHAFLAVPVGVGVYIPATKKAYYINVGHVYTHDDIPMTPIADLVTVFQQFFMQTNVRAVGQNIIFDMSINHKLGIQHRCKLEDSMILAHRWWENFNKNKDQQTPTSLWHKDPKKHYIGYGLKQLIMALFNIEAPTLASIGDPRVSDPLKIAKYCILDCQNTWRLRKRLIHKVSRTLRELDWQALMSVFNMMMAGIPIDVAALDQQLTTVTKHVEQCQAHICKRAGRPVSFNSPTEILECLKPLLPPDQRPQRTALFGDLPGTTGDERKEILEEINSLSKSHPLKRDRLVQLFDEQIQLMFLIQFYIDSQMPQADALLPIIILLLIQTDILAALISRNVAAHRLSSFLKPMKEKYLIDGRVYLRKFLPLTTTTRYSSVPNMQAFPKKAEGFTDKGWWRALPKFMQYVAKTRGVIATRKGHLLISCDLAAAEPRYCAVRCEWSLNGHGPDDPFKQGKWLHVLKSRARARSKAEYPDLHEWSTERRVRWSKKPKDMTYPALEHDPLWIAFHQGKDPYKAMAQAIGITDRDVVKQLWLSVIYGKSIEGVAFSLKKTYEQARALISDLFKQYPMLEIIQEETHRQLLLTGEVQTLWGRRRRIPGLYQLAHHKPCTLILRYRKRDYITKIIPLVMLRWGVHAFISECKRMDTGQIVLTADRVTKNFWADKNDLYMNADHEVGIPFRNISYSCIQRIRLPLLPPKSREVYHELPRFAAAKRSAFNAIFQGTGADHLRWLMVRLDQFIRTSFPNVRMILSVHDELLFECPCMQVMQFIDGAEAIITTTPPTLSVPIKTEFKIGPNYAEMSDLSSHYHI